MTHNLSHDEVRVLGSLVEKQNTTPDYYPLTLNSLLNACNQKSNREPVITLDESRTLRAIDSLKEAKLAWMVQAVDARVPKYEHNFDRHFNLTLQETAVMCVLMLRGPQTIGELRQRCSRIYPFESLDEVAVTLQALMDAEDPLALKLPLQPGRKEARYAHLLSGEPEFDQASFAPSMAGSEEASYGVDPDELTALRDEVEALRDEVASLKEAFDTFKAQFE